MMEKKISDLIQPGRVDRGVDHDRVRAGLGQPVDGGLAAVVGAVARDDEHPGRVVVLRAAQDLAGQVHERLDPGGCRGGGEHFPGVHVEAGQQGERAVAHVFVLDAHGLAGGGRGGGVATAAGLDGGLGVEGQQPVTGPQRLPLIEPPVQVEDDFRLGFEVRGAGIDPGPVLPGLDRVLGQDPQDGRRRDGAGQAAGGQFRAGPPGQRHPGGGGQPAGQRDHRGPLRRGRPDLGRSFSPSTSPASATNPPPDPRRTSRTTH
jgi:hypothetical protein